MELMHNPRYLGETRQMFKSFLLGSLITSSSLYFIFTEDLVVFFLSLGLIAAGFILFVYMNMSFGRKIHTSQNVFFLLAGTMVSLVFHAMGFLLLYLSITVILVLVVWLHRYKVHVKKVKKIGKIRKKS